MTAPLRIAIIGTARRSDYLYGPLLKALPEVDLVSVWGHSESSARQLGESEVEVAEQFYRRPMEQIKLKLLKSGLFGKVHSSSNDFTGHGYHGVSVMRSCLGFDAKPVQVTGAVRKYDLTAHWSRFRPGNHSSHPQILRRGWSTRKLAPLDFMLSPFPFLLSPAF